MRKAPLRALFLALAALVPAGWTQPLPASGGAAPSRIDEHYRLNIDQRRWTEPGYEGGSELKVDQPRLNCRVGVSVKTGQINVELQEVRGEVHFQANPARIQSVLEALPHRP